MKLSVMDVIFCTTVVTGIISNLKPSLLFFVIFFANVSNFMYDVITIGKLEYILTGMCYGFESLHVEGPNWTLFIEIFFFPKWHINVMTSVITLFDDVSNLNCAWFVQ